MDEQSASPGTDQTSMGDSTATAQAPAGNWYDGFDDDTRGYVQNKGWQKPDDLLNSYRNLEKLTGAGPDKLFKLPDDGDTEGWNNLYGKLGRPEKPVDYKLPLPEGADGEFADWAKGTFHELGLTTKQGEALAAKWNEFVGGKATASQEQFKMEIANQDKALKQEWGAAYEQNLNVARNAARELGFDAPTVDKLEQSLGFSGLMKMMHNIGSKVGEASFVSGDTSTGKFGIMTPEAARSQIKALQSDAAFVRDYTAGKVDARQKMQQLHQWAYPE